VLKARLVRDMISGNCTGVWLVPGDALETPMEKPLLRRRRAGRFWSRDNLLDILVVLVLF
jgi:hypothetical protein